MKKAIFALLILTAFTLTFVNCEKNEEVNFLPSSTTQISIDQVKSTFESSFKREAFPNLRLPLWEKAENYTLNGKSVIEVPFYTLKESDLAESTAFSYDKLVASFDLNNNLSVHIVHFYSKDVEKALSTIISYSEPKDFNGFITVFDFDKTPLEVNRYINGVKSKKQYEFKSRKYEEGETILKRVNDVCEMAEEIIYTRTCWFWTYESGYVEIIDCSPWVPEINSYLVCEGSDGADGSEGAGVTHRTEEEEIINNLSGDAKCVFRLLLEKNGNLFKTTIGKFIDNPDYHLQINSGGTCPTGADGCTDGSNINSGLAIINIVNEGRGTLDLAATILHEGIHAEIYKYVNEYRKGLDPNDRPNLLGYYFQYENISVSTAQHQHMADKFVKPIAEAIRELDNNRYPLEDYMGFGWDGLRKYGWDGYYDNGVWKDLDKDESKAYYKTQKKVLDNTIFNSNCN